MTDEPCALAPMAIQKMRQPLLEGKGTSYRVDPKAVVKVLPFLTAKKQTGQK